MTNIDTMKLALDALETLDCGDSYKTHNAATALRQAISEAEQAEQEPVADNSWKKASYCRETIEAEKQEPVAAESKFFNEQKWERCEIAHHNLVQSEPDKWPSYQTRLLYTAPPQREWVSLTDDEYDQAYAKAIASFRKHNSCVRGQQITERDDPNWHFYRAIESYLKEKNK